MMFRHLPRPSSAEAELTAVLGLMRAPSWTLDGSAEAAERSVRDVLEGWLRTSPGPAPWQVRLTHPQLGRFLFEVAADGAVRAFLRRGPVEVMPAGSIDVGPLWVVAAYPGAGTSTWADLFGGAEPAPQTVITGPVLVVTRASVDGIEHAKRFASIAGVVLTVPEGPGKPMPDVRRAGRVLSGVVPVVEVPWVKEMSAAAESAAVKRVVATVAATVRDNWRNTSE
ncbi:hypothetical protein JVX92_15075 (plasmid) [Microbacterium hominis]|uniref:hypothetical protein n=1 Tax=Microbacterium hominis TaxID=162426 RepID=UPI0019641E7E|nr:hypothetical protein [Microbacterium hominis]QRY42303.1 hypothetical protein JVX92_15075 [Microbacterium hominis]